MARRLPIPQLCIVAIFVLNTLTGCRTMSAQEQKTQNVLSEKIAQQASGALDLDAAAVRMATSFASAPGIEWKKVIVGNLVDPQGQKFALSGNIAGAVETALGAVSANTGKFVVLKRRDVSRTAAEWKLDLTGAFARSFKMIKTLLDADILIVGNATAEGQFVRVNLNGVDLTTGAILWRQSISVKEGSVSAGKEPVGEGKPLRAGAIKVDLWSDKETYAVGDAMTINFKTDHDCYIMLIEIDTTGTMRILYPNRRSPEDHAIANTTYSIGGKDSGYTVPVSGPAGVAIVRAIATPAPVGSPVSAGSIMDNIFQRVGNAPAFARELTVQTMVTPPFQRGGNLIRVTIKE